MAAIALRKQDIIRRKAIAKRDKEAREAKIDEQTQRALNRDQHIQDCTDKWNLDNADAIDAFKKYEEIKALSEKGEDLDET